MDSTELAGQSIDGFGLCDNGCMTLKKVLIAGATGLVGYAAMKHFARADRTAR